MPTVTFRVLPSQDFMKDRRLHRQPASTYHITDVVQGNPLPLGPGRRCSMCQNESEHNIRRSSGLMFWIFPQGLPLQTASGLRMAVKQRWFEGDKNIFAFLVRSGLCFID